MTALAVTVAPVEDPTKLVIIDVELEAVLDVVGAVLTTGFELVVELTVLVMLEDPVLGVTGVVAPVRLVERLVIIDVATGVEVGAVDCVVNAVFEIEFVVALAVTVFIGLLVMAFVTVVTPAALLLRPIIIDVGTELVLDTVGWLLVLVLLMIELVPVGAFVEELVIIVVVVLDVGAVLVELVVTPDDEDESSVVMIDVGSTAAVLDIVVWLVALLLIAEVSGSTDENASFNCLLPL